MAFYIFLALLCYYAQAACLGIQRITKTIPSSKRYLVVEILTDDIIHFEVSETTRIPAGSIYKTQMIDSDNFDKNFNCGPNSYAATSNGFNTGNLRVSIDQNSLSITVFDLILNTELTTFTYANLASIPELHWSKTQTKTIYGLSTDFQQDYSDVNWVGKYLEPPLMRGKPSDSFHFGNAMKVFDVGASATVQLPVAYNLGTNGFNYAFMLDNVYAHKWDLTNDWKVTMSGTLRGFVMRGSSLIDLRQKYMLLVGPPSLVVKEYFGLQLSIFGYRSFQEIYSNLDILANLGFPIDGVLIDFYWFGGNSPSSDSTAFGTLTWDTSKFSSPGYNIKNIRDKYGVGVTLIEEPLIGKNTPTHQMLANAYALARNSGLKTPSYLTYNPWWGNGGLIDFSSPGSDLWMDCKRCALLLGCSVDQRKCNGQPQTEQADLAGIWTDLGDPEEYLDDSMYWGYNETGIWKTTHGDIHNIYQLLSSKSLHDGYVRNNLRRRPSNLVRSGAPGIQRYGIAMWSGDLSSYMPVLGSHLSAQSHAIMAGVDFFGSDVGGFNRAGSRNRGIDEEVTYSQWMSISAWMDIPLRPHAGRSNNQVDDPKVRTNPAVTGDVASNKFNIIQRYELTPFYYSLAHRANTQMLPIHYPMFLAFQNDSYVWKMSDQFMLGEALLIKTFTGYTDTNKNNIPKSTSVYLPAGVWINYHTNQVFISQSGLQINFPLVQTINGVTVQTAPVFARQGAIVPKTWIDSNSMNVLGARRDGSRVDTLIARVWPSSTKTEFTVYDDDGVTSAYLSGSKTSTTITQVLVNSTVRVEFQATTGTFQNAPTMRQFSAEVVLSPGQNVKTVLVNGKPANAATLSPVDQKSGWTVKNGVLFAYSDVVSTNTNVLFEVGF